MVEVAVSICIPNDNLFEQVVDDASRVGLNIHDKLTTLGIVTGSIERRALVELRRVPGVESVEEQREVAIGAHAH